MVGTTPEKPIVSVRDIDLGGLRVFCRVDFNVPLEGEEIRDDARIRASLPTIRHLRQQKAKVILATHLGYPEGRVVEEWRLPILARHLARLLGHEVLYVGHSTGEAAERGVKKARFGDVLLLENVRFQPGETKNSRELARSYAKLADVFVNDAFATLHRAHASVAGIAEFLPSFAGLLVEREVSTLRHLREQSGLTVIMGGSKASDKIRVISKMLERSDHVLLGGVLANIFLMAQGRKSRCPGVDADLLHRSSALMARAKELGKDLMLPVDVAVEVAGEKGRGSEYVDVSDLDESMKIVDIGPRTTGEYRKRCLASKWLVWNGPMGIFEKRPNDKGTLALLQALRDARAFRVCGGGDTVAAINKLGGREGLDHVSTGGGALLRFLEGAQLPGLLGLQRGSEALRNVRLFSGTEKNG